MTEALNRIVRPDYALRIADVPQGSLPRGISIENTLTRLAAERFDLDEHQAQGRDVFQLPRCCVLQ